MNNQEIIKRLDNLREHCREMGQEGGEVWRQDENALQEAMDIINDYDNISLSLNRMTQQYEMPKEPRKTLEGIYLCRNCGKRTQVMHSHCHWCGQMLKWDKGRKENRG